MIFILISFLPCYGQKHTIVLSKDGKIIKNYGYSSDSKKEFNYEILIEDITESESKKYFLLWQWRNEYNHLANNTLDRNSVVNVENFSTNGTLKIALSCNKGCDFNHRYFCYQLLKVNDLGAKIIKENSNCMSLALLKQKSAESEVYLSGLQSYPPTELEILNSSVDSLRQHNSVLKKLRSEQSKLKYPDPYTRLVTSKNKLEIQIEIKKDVLEKISNVDEAQSSPKYLDSIARDIINLELKLIDTVYAISKIKEIYQKEIDQYTNKVAKVSSEIKVQFFKNTGSSTNHLKTPLYEVLRQGVFISKDHDTHEIVYDSHYEQIFSSEESQLILTRLTPDLPQLTTASELYCHILNLKPQYFKQNPYLISLSTEYSPVVEIESPSNFKALESIDISALEGLSDKAAEINTAALGDDISIRDFLSFSDTISREKTCTDSIYLDVVKSKISGYIKEFEFFKNYESRIDKLDAIDTKNCDFAFISTLIKDMKNTVSLIYKPLFDQISKIILIEYSDEPKYTEYVLKYPKEFEALKKPTISLYSRQYYTDNYVNTIENGKSKGVKYDVKNQSIELVKDELSPVHRLYRFSLNAGIIVTRSLKYTYLEVPLVGSSGFDLEEYKEIIWDIRPSITFSTYFVKQDLAVNYKNWFRSSHFDVSLDYADANLIDNLYLGYGIEPIRNLHIATGVRFGMIEKVSKEKLNASTQNIEDAKSSYLYPSIYFSVNLGFNLIPAAINYLF